ncbi:hypothetical protein ACVOMV_29770 [Mesorhizobium atlanticum]
MLAQAQSSVEALAAGDVPRPPVQLVGDGGLRAGTARARPEHCRCSRSGQGAGRFSQLVPEL